VQERQEVLQNRKPGYMTLRTYFIRYGLRDLNIRRVSPGMRKNEQRADLIGRRQFAFSLKSEFN